MQRHALRRVDCERGCECECEREGLEVIVEASEMVSMSIWMLDLASLMEGREREERGVVAVEEGVVVVVIVVVVGVCSRGAVVGRL